METTKQREARKKTCSFRITPEIFEAIRIAVEGNGFVVDSNTQIVELSLWYLLDAAESVSAKHFLREFGFTRRLTERKEEDRAE